MDVRQKIKVLMEQKHMTVYALAQKSDLTTACIQNWYSARNYLPSVDALEKVCGALGITMAELFCEDDQKMMAVNEEQRELLNLWQVLSADKREILLKLIKTMTD